MQKAVTFFHSFIRREKKIKKRGKKKKDRIDIVNERITIQNKIRKNKIRYEIVNFRLIFIEKAILKIKFLTIFRTIYKCVLKKSLSDLLIFLYF